ncbi:alpha/beta hydrolase [Okeania sp.]|uniref:alpha/beta fold hydrolase n=1 Tax=Okeania sp. TaxID=3100323 RepID=UPI002B4B3DFF|nr:alpha/beta hydrolase [Okeania sp.]MEB3341456.1 alpha/beta hydrolase [Okeania sp.]
MNFLWLNSRVKLSDGLLFWREIGTGSSCIVFLHGTSFDSSQWLLIMEELSLNYHCFAPDLPGFNKSKFSSKYNSISEMVESLAEYIAALKLERIYLVGESLGAWIAVSYALRYSDKLLGLILVSPEGVDIPEVKARWQFFGWLSLRLFLLRFILGLIYRFYRLLRLKRKAKRLLQVREKLLLCMGGNKVLFWRRWLGIKVELLGESLNDLRLSTLILQGDKDQEISLAMSKCYADLLPMAKLDLVDSGEDNLPEQMPDMVVQKILDFLQQEEGKRKKEEGRGKREEGRGVEDESIDN